MSKAKRPITRFIASLVIIGIIATIFCGCQSQSEVEVPACQRHGCLEAGSRGRDRLRRRLC